MRQLPGRSLPAAVQLPQRPAQPPAAAAAAGPAAAAVAGPAAAAVAARVGAAVAAAAGGVAHVCCAPADCQLLHVGHWAVRRLGLKQGAGVMRSRDLPGAAPAMGRSTSRWVQRAVSVLCGMDLRPAGATCSDMGSAATAAE